MKTVSIISFTCILHIDRIHSAADKLIRSKQNINNIFRLYLKLLKYIICILHVCMYVRPPHAHTK